MSHEIRTPLNAIVGFSGLMVHCDNPEEKEEYMNIIESNNELLLRLINDILDLSKIESGILERKREKFNLSKTCNELYMMIQQKITNPDVKVFVDNPYADCWIFLDANRLKQVWMNFLTNAVKCTQEGFIKMGYSIENEGIRFYVQDSGVGIPIEVQDRVFGRFQKLNEFAQGTGLGLAISRAIIEGAGGKIGFTSKPGIGSTFGHGFLVLQIHRGLTWPRKTKISGPSVSVPPLPSLSDINKKVFKVLIAEDNDSNFSLVQHILFKYNLTRVKMEWKLLRRYVTNSMTSSSWI
ncbi:HAMP domain-containing sensor histidine kinase [Bacteroides sp. CR5/BHMF/2]|nr:HAMP domain-containing sensor histidine kinase [Bacteroides sp. CR5/BHMF/2]